MASIPQTIANAATQNGVPPALALQVAFQESSFNPNAVGSAGEQGLFQLSAPVQAAYGVTNPFDPAQNSDGGTAYLSDLFAQFGDWATALTAFNWGPGNVAKYGAAAAPASTQAYVSTALAAASEPSQVSVTPGSVANGVSDVFANGSAAQVAPEISDLFPSVDLSGAPSWIWLAIGAVVLYVGWDLTREYA